MITSKDCYKAFGDPNLENNLVPWFVPDYVWKYIPTIPRKIYCNKEMLIPLETAFLNIIDRGLTDEVKTWDGCFNIRKKRGNKSMSLHSWAIAIDINRNWNQYGKKPQMSKELVQCFKDAGFDWGGDWTNPIDGMHFQLSYLTALSHK